MNLRYLLVLSLFTASVLPIAGLAQNGPKAAREISEVLEVIPSKDLLKLRGNSKPQSLVEASNKLMAAEVNNTSTFKLKVGKAIPWNFPQQGGGSGWRVEASERYRSGGLTIECVAYLYIRQDPQEILPKIRPGAELMATGKVTRCDLNSPNKIILNMDVQVESFELAK